MTSTGCDESLALKTLEELTIKRQHLRGAITRSQNEVRSLFDEKAEPEELREKLRAYEIVCKKCFDDHEAFHAKLDNPRAIKDSKDYLTAAQENMQSFRYRAEVEMAQIEEALQ